MNNFPNIYSDSFIDYALNVIKPRLLEMKLLIQQAESPSKEIFENSPDLESSILNVILDSLPTHTLLSKQLLDSAQMRNSLKEFLLGPAQLLEELREKSLSV
ncbi:hypothetical protein [Limnohabitans sp. Bal53]|uniref:hypothetical protein n=1 Tax=Limnohabitans sp. Bal53 TaxID=1977910 RepID=UPI000D3BB934|nr:hypothetical protein [Limnohabitans sp. Bal53]PUE40184.1 hypothetical protein B9Z50_12030 [Limnohabitans sp. Bal53]